MPAVEDWDPGDEIDLRHYWNIINRRKWGILGLALAVGVLTTLVVFAMTPIYRASATLLIETQQNNVVSIEEVYGLDTRSQEYLATQFEILGARPIAEAVVDKLKLVEQSEFRPDDQPSLIDVDWRSWLPFGMQKKAGFSEADQRESAVRTYLEKLTIEPVRKTQLVRVQFDSPDPKLAAEVANAHAKAYIDSTLDARVSATKSAAEWMAERLDTLRQDLQASEAALQAYREEEQLVDVAGLKALPAQEIGDLSSRLLEVRQALASAEIAYLQVSPAAGRPEDLQGVPALLADEGMRRARAAQAVAQQEVAELANRYGPAHPKLAAAQAELNQATANVDIQARSVIDSIRKRYEAAKSEEAAIMSALYRARQQYQTVGRKESKLESLQRVVDTNRQLYDLFYKRLSETSATSDLSAAEARVVVPAEVPRLPAKPKKRQIVMIAVLLALLFSVGVAFLLASLDNTVKGAGDTEEKLRRPLLGMVPLLKRGDVRVASTLTTGDGERVLEPRFAEAMRTIRTAVSLDSLEQPHKIILVTSAVAGEGKSLVALNLAAALAASDRTLLLDADMRRPTLEKMLGLPRDTPGLSELLAKNADLKDCLVRTSVRKLHAISHGFIPPDPLQLLSSSRMASALKALGGVYARIVIDCPPVLPVSDAVMLSKYADAVLFVVKSDATTVLQIQHGLNLLERVNAPLTGIVLTQVDTRKAEKYSDYGYAGYYESYASKS